MQIGIVIATNDQETVWNAFRYGSSPGNRETR